MNLRACILIFLMHYFCSL